MQWWKISIGVLAVGALGWLGWYVTRPVPGTRMEDQGREHVSVEEVAAYPYNSNPPTSGQHLPTWVKTGVYDAPQSEGELIHSLEHGYIIISYNCNIHFTQNVNFKLQTLNFFENVYAHEEGEEEGSPSASLSDPTIATGSATNDTEGCKTLVKNLTDVATNKKLWKLIVVPRPQLPTTIALTAWTYIDTFDAYNAGRIERFIDYHRDQGPEKTME